MKQLRGAFIRWSNEDDFCDKLDDVWHSMISAEILQGLNCEADCSCEDEDSDWDGDYEEHRKGA